jgi:tellurite resistance protein TerA
MELKQKGSQANVGGFKQLIVTMKWTTAADFDLAAAYETKTGKQGLVYFGDLGKLNAFPFMQLSGDEGVGDKQGDNQEIMRITKLDDMKYVWIMCWDYGKIQTGAPARFKDSDISISVKDDKKNNHNVTLDTGSLGNVALMATIDNTSAVGVKLINESKAGTLKGLKNLQQLLDIIELNETTESESAPTEVVPEFKL